MSLIQVLLQALLQAPTFPSALADLKNSVDTVESGWHQMGISGAAGTARRAEKATLLQDFIRTGDQMAEASERVRGTLGRSSGDAVQKLLEIVQQRRDA